MARRAAAGTALVSWEDQLAKEAEIAKAAEASSTGGTFFSLKSGVLSFNDTPIPDNQMAVVILDSILENTYYDQPYNADQVAVPKCFAFARDANVMAPHPVVVEHGQQENDTCNGCEKNEWGSAETGKGKACANRRRLSMLSAGVPAMNGRLDELYTLDHFEKSGIGLMRLPVMSVKGYASYVNQIATVMRRPPLGVITLVKVVPDQRSQFTVTFTLIDRAPDELIPILMKRRDETRETLEQPYNLDMNEPEPAPARRPTLMPNGRRKSPPIRAKY